MRILMAQVVGIVGMVLLALCFQTKDKKKTLLIKFSADIVWGIHYLLLGGISGIVLNVIGATRETAFYFEENEKRRKVWLICFVLINLIVGIVTYSKFYNILPILVSAVSTYSFWQKNLKTLRLFAVVNAVIMFTYDIFVASYVGMISEAITVVSVCIALYRYRKTGTAY